MPPPGELAAKAKDEVGAKAHELGSEAQTRMRDELDTRSTKAGDGLISVGDALRRSSEQLRGEGKDMPAQVVEGVSRRADDIGRYLRTADANEILDDVEGYARRNPWLTAVAGAAVGFAASRFLKASSARRYDRRPVVRTGTGTM
jgi:ElaB/YqjD/DUF883 family membrane-anchored ribosome-binding protein